MPHRDSNPDARESPNQCDAATTTMNRDRDDAVLIEFIPRTMQFELTLVRVELKHCTRAHVQW